jgi:hypothetical protein
MPRLPAPLSDRSARFIGSAEIEAGAMRYRLDDGRKGVLSWTDAALSPGWCKLDWVAADPAGKGLTNVSNVLDPTEYLDGVASTQTPMGER